MGNAAVFISDLHFGTLTKLDDFDSHKEFENFLNVKLDGEFRDDDFDLVFLGDTFDLWQSISESELPQKMGSKWTWNFDKIHLEIDRSKEQQKIQQIIEKNHQVFDSLAGFLNRVKKRKVIFIPGNHDHSLVHKDVQQQLKSFLTERGVEEHQIILGQNYYENSSLQVYAEHGNQFDEDNKYANFSVFPEGPLTYQKECRGYFFVRLFWNLLKSVDPSIGTAPSRWYKVFNWLMKTKLGTVFPIALKLFADYRRYPKHFDRISIFQQVTNFLLNVEDREKKAEDLLVFPKNIFEDIFDPCAVFSDDKRVEDLYRKLYFESDEALQGTKEVINLLLKEKPQRMPSPCTVPHPLSPSRSLEEELKLVPSLPSIRPIVNNPASGAERGLLLGGKDIRAATKILTSGRSMSLKREPLVPKPSYIVFGHTHQCVEEPLKGGSRYFNTGTWVGWEDEKGTKHKDLSYVCIHSQHKQVKANLCHFFKK